MTLSHKTRSASTALVAGLLVILQAVPAPVAAASGPAVALKALTYPGVETPQYLDRPFSIVIALVDVNGEVVTDGTTATITLTNESGLPGVLTCSGGTSQPLETSGPRIGTVTFAGCLIDREGYWYYIEALASQVVSGSGQALSIPPLHGGPFRVAQQASTIKVSWSKAPVWGQAVTVKVVFTEHGANQPFQLQQSTRRMDTWVPLANLTTDATGVATFRYRPSVTTRYRVLYAGSPGLAAGTSDPTSAMFVISLAIQRPTQSTPRIIRRGTTVAFATTARPILPDAPARVWFGIYHRTSSGTWKLVAWRDRVVDALGVARVSLTFGGRGEWYVRSGVLARWVPDVNTEDVPPVAWASRLTPIARYSVR